MLDLGVYKLLLFPPLLIAQNDGWDADDVAIVQLDLLILVRWLLRVKISTEAA
jgi:hypothetical protein